MEKQELISRAVGLKAEYLRREKEKIKIDARSNYVKYVQYVHNLQWVPAKHLKYIGTQLEAFLSSDKKGLIISMPPQHGKSQMITETLPSYFIGRNPEKRVIIVSYGDDLARRFGRRNKQKIEEFGKELFNVEISSQSRSDTEMEISKSKGTIISRGIMSGITGQPGDLIIIDDPIKNKQEADSETYRERVWEEWLSTIRTRLSANGKVILIMTRWHEDDLAGRLLSQEPEKWNYVNLPAEAEENDVLGREVGEALFPEIGKDTEWLQDFKKAYMSIEGSRAWNALFQGRPTSLEGNLIKREWWRFYEDLPEMMQVVISVDAAFKDSDTSDFVAIQVWGKRGTNIYLIDSINRRMDFPNTVSAIRQMKSKYRNANRIFIEDKANGSAIISVLRKEIIGIVPIEPQGNKLSRVNAITGALESGNVYLPKNADFIGDFMEQASSFPKGKHDDMVDAMSQALLRLIFFSSEIPRVYTDAELEERPDYKYNVMLKEVTGGKPDRGFFKEGT
jgi:predicted phage terminase large subunit-like protein